MLVVNSRKIHLGELFYPGIENHILFSIIFHVVEDPGSVKPVEVVHKPLPDMLMGNLLKVTSSLTSLSSIIRVRMMAQLT